MACQPDGLGSCFINYMAFFCPSLTNAVLKSPCLKGGFRGIIGWLYNPPCSPLKKGGKILAFIEAFSLKAMPYSLQSVTLDVIRLEASFPSLAGEPEKRFPEPTGASHPSPGVKASLAPSSPPPPLSRPAAAGSWPATPPRSLPAPPGRFPGHSRNGRFLRPQRRSAPPGGW